MNASIFCELNFQKNIFNMNGKIVIRNIVATSMADPRFNLKIKHFINSQNQNLSSVNNQKQSSIQQILVGIR